MRFCTACGTPVSAARSYCTHCGATIRRTGDPTLATDPSLAAAQVSAARGDQTQPASAPAAGPGTAQATAPVLAAAEPASPGRASPGRVSQEPAGPETASISLPGTWLADFDQPAEPPGRGQPPPLQATPAASGRTLLAVALVAVIIAAGSAAWMAGSSRPQTGHHRTTASSGSGRHLASAAHSASPRPAKATPTPIPSSRRGIVSVSPALAKRGDAQQVAGFLDSYFAAVNHREYLEYSSLFERWHHLTQAEFNRGYRTTHDSSAMLVGLSSSKDTLTATVTFTSHQDPAASPNHALCTNWRIVLYLRRVGDVYLIGPPPAGYHATYHGCG